MATGDVSLDSPSKPELSGGGGGNAVEPPNSSRATFAQLNRLLLVIEPLNLADRV